MSTTGSRLTWLVLAAALVVVTAGCAATTLAENTSSPADRSTTTVPPDRSTPTATTDRPTATATTDKSTPTAPADQPTGSVTPTATHTVPDWVGDPPTGTETPPVRVSAAGDRAIEHETERIRAVEESLPRVTGFSVGILHPPSSEPLAVNETGVTLRVEVGYSLEIDCDASPDSTPEVVIDGASTITRYFVGQTTVQLVSVERGVLDPDRHCDSSDDPSATETSTEK